MSEQTSRIIDRMRQKTTLSIRTPAPSSDDKWARLLRAKR